MKSRRSLLSRAAGPALIALATLTSCREAEKELTAPPVFAARAPANGAPTVTSVVPDSSPPGVTLDITVNGSGFAKGAAVTLERQGAPAAKITTNSTTFVTTRKLIANITIAADADSGKYDVAVVSSDRKGVGIESFTVAYVIDELGIIGGTWSRAHAINDRGEVVGASCTSDCLATAFYWTEAGGMQSLGTLPGFSRSEAYAINNRSQIFGAVICRSTDPGCGGTSKERLVRWDKVGASWLITPVDGCSVVDFMMDVGNETFVINNNEQCVGSRVTPAGRQVVFQTLSGGAVVNEQPLPLLVPGGYATGYAISDAAMIAGRASRSGGGYEPVVWYRTGTQGWVILQLGLASTDYISAATGIGEPDAAGRVRVTGWTDPGSGDRYSALAVRWTLEPDGSGGWRVASTERLENPKVGGGSLLRAWGKAVHSNGDVVGLSLERPARWPVSGGIEILPVPNGGNKGRAMDINNMGWIVGAVWDNSNNCDRAAIWRLR